MKEVAVIGSAAQLAMGSHQLARRALSLMADEQIPGALMMQLGQLIESSRTLGRDIQEIKQQQVANATRSEKDREGIRAEIEHTGHRISAVEDEIISIKSKQQQIADSQFEMKKVTDKVNRWQWAGGGAIGVTGLFFGLIGWLMAHYWDRLFGGP